MKTYYAVCLKDENITDKEKSFTLKQGNKYIISPVDSNGNVTVFSTYWIHGVNANLFDNLTPGPGN